MSTILVERVLPTDQTLQIVQGDITIEDVDVIVNAANEHLHHGGGVAWAISKKGGPAIQQESDAWIRQHGRPGTADMTRRLQAARVRIIYGERY